jgi:hypothetical protein
VKLVMELDIKIIEHMCSLASQGVEGREVELLNLDSSTPRPLDFSTLDSFA